MNWLSADSIMCTTKTGDSCMGPLSFDATEPIHLVVGPNGSGKTILGRSLANLSPSIQSDDLVCSGHWSSASNTKRYSPREFSYFPQAWDLILIGGKINVDIDMISRHTQIPRRQFETAIQSMGFPVAGRSDSSPFSLSRGEIQRLSLGILFGLRPCIAYLDEPDAFLDQGGVERLLVNLNDHRDLGSHFLVATHRPELYSCLDAPLIELPRIKAMVNANESEIMELEDANRGAAGGPDLGSRLLRNGEMIKLSSRRTMIIDYLPILPGKLTAVYGNNSDGKTSLLRWICTHFPIESTDGWLRDGRMRITMVSENPDDQLGFKTLAHELWSRRSVYPTTSSGIEIALQRVGPLDSNILDLSWGQRRLFTIILALLQEPHVLLIDEPEVGLDTSALNLVRYMLEEALRKRIAVIVSVNRKSEIWKRADFKTSVEKDKNSYRVTQWRDR